MKVAALDLGTNSFLCLIAEVDQNKIKSIVSDQVEVVRLGQEVQQTKRFHPEALERAEKCLQNFRKTIDLHKPEKILAMATSAARDVSNAEELFYIGKKLMIPIEIIPGNKEAEITFFGSISGESIGSQETAVIDIGGGSTEIILGSEKEIHFSKSVNIGAVRLTEMFFPSQPPNKESVKQAQSYIQEQMKNFIAPVEKFNPKTAIAVAGTPTELAKVILGGFDAKKIDGFKIDQKTLQTWLEKLLTTTTEERQRQLGFTAGRADIILAGVLILIESLKTLGLEELRVSTRGVRFGVALEIARRAQ